MYHTRQRTLQTIAAKGKGCAAGTCPETAVECGTHTILSPYRKCHLAGPVLRGFAAWKTGQTEEAAGLLDDVRTSR